MEGRELMSGPSPQPVLGATSGDRRARQEQLAQVVSVNQVENVSKDGLLADKGQEAMGTVSVLGADRVENGNPNQCCAGNAFKNGKC